MTNKIGIEVDGQIDTSAIESGLNSLGQKIAAANRVQFQPFNRTTVADVERVVRSFEQLRKINGDLNKRMKATGQGNAGLLEVDWAKLYPDEHSRARQMRKAFEYTTGRPLSPSPTQGAAQSEPSEPPAASSSRRPERPPGGPTWGGVAGQVAQSGLRAAGPAGGVAANAVGTGMASGVGAGLMGLMGGMLALGVGKIVGSIADKIEQAEANNVALDRLKRTLGDVNVSFDALKSVVHSGADNLKITYDEAGKLATQFTKLGNVKGDQYGTLADELGVGVGMSRAYGLDPSQGVGVMGQMRGVGVTQNTQDSRRFALLIGETIGRSGAFAKADEVMEAIAGYATSQTRQNMSAANTDGYAGTYSALVGSGVPGLDPSGAGALLARVNSSLSAGGAHGEASQFFTGRIGAGMGLNPYQTRMLREQGAFATADDAFGDKSVYARYKGLKPGDARPTGNGTLLQGTLDKLRKQYGEGSDELADATANHLGVGINQAMGLLSIKPNEMGEMNKYAGDLTKLSGSGIGNLSKALYGSKADRQGLSESLLRREDVSSEHKSKLRTAMAGGDEGKQKEVLARLTAQYDQERTMGSDIRDSKAALDNIKTNLADKLVPAVEAMRAAMVYMAGDKGKKSEREIMQEVVKLESRDRVSAIKGDFATKKDDARGEVIGFGNLIDAQRADFQRTSKNLSPEAKAARQEYLTALENEQRERMTTLRDRIQKLSEDEAKAIAAENEERDKRIKAIKSGLAGTVADGGGGVAGKVVPASLAGTGAAGGGVGLPPQGGGGAGGAPASSGGGSGSAGAQPTLGAAPSAVGGGGGGGQSSASAPSGAAAPSGASTGGGSAAQGASSAAAGGDVPKNKQAAVDQSMKFFMEKGWSKEQAAGITANLVAESGMRTGAVGDSGRAYGVAQWHPDRQREFAKWSGKDIREATLQEQLGFVHYEKTQGRERAAGDRLKNASTAQQAGSVVSQYYERPADRYGEASKRANMAAKIAANYKEPKQQAGEAPKPAQNPERDAALPPAVAAATAPAKEKAPSPKDGATAAKEPGKSTGAGSALAPSAGEGSLPSERGSGAVMPDDEMNIARKTAEQLHRIQDGKLTVEVLNGQTKKPMAPPQDIAVKVDRARPSSLNR